MNIFIATIYNLVAQAYGSCTYGSGTEGSGSCSGSAASNSSGSALANTGLLLAIIITAACLLIFATLVVRIWRKKK
ncbi:MAG TPA: hypothetical protein VF401_00430 [Candidatus Saccharimonadales bacterium]